jgi:hypothetical protein
MKCNSGMVIPTYNLHTLEAKGIASQFQGQPEPQSQMHSLKQLRNQSQLIQAGVTQWNPEKITSVSIEIQAYTYTKVYMNICMYMHIYNTGFL